MIFRILRFNPRGIKLNFQSIHLTRCVSNATESKEIESKNTGSFVPVYKFPYIRIFSTINRLKIYQTALAVTSLPLSTALYQMDVIDFNGILYTLALGVSGCLSLYGVGAITNKFIGFVYYNEQDDTAKISYVDFWGRRKDIVIPAKDVVPISELPVAPLDGLFLIFRRFSTKDTLRFCHKFGIVLDKENYKKVFC